MPKRPLCAGSEQDATQTIHVLLKPNGNRQLYLRIDGLEWLLSYAADEHHFQGIVRQAALPTPAVAEEDRIEWEFNERHWVATVMVGPAAGKKQCFNQKGLGFHKWSKQKKENFPGRFQGQLTTFCRDNSRTLQEKYQTLKNAKKVNRIPWKGKMKEGGRA